MVAILLIRPELLLVEGQAEHKTLESDVVHLSLKEVLTEAMCI
jgi:hypothetical protein|tara:strand:- start:728 stop:856 length:129 start_codon:yes stop_codon:yes gene_type:complete